MVLLWVLNRKLRGCPVSGGVFIPATTCAPGGTRATSLGFGVTRGAYPAMAKGNTIVTIALQIPNRHAMSWAVFENTSSFINNPRYAISGPGWPAASLLRSNDRKGDI